MSLSSKEIADFFEWTSWNTKARKEKEKGGKVEEGMEKRKKREKKEWKKEIRTKHMSFGVMTVLWAFFGTATLPSEERIMLQLS